MLAALLAGPALPAARAGGKGDHDRARAAVQAGEVLALPVLLERLQRTHPGRVLELELEHEDVEHAGPAERGGRLDRDGTRERDREGVRTARRWIYEVRLLQPDGRLVKLHVDAATGQVLKTRDESPGRDRRPSGRDGQADKDQRKDPRKDERTDGRR
ncbi:MAG: PepSY domain-containing protein [Rubrivivax sp.]|nr:PepSY domain-containing protein [Rubrivivax sp.]